MERAHAGKIDSWAYPWHYTLIVNGGLAVRPERNLVENIGYGPLATHTRRRPWALSPPAAAPITFPLRHPKRVTVDHDADRRYYTRVIRPRQRLIFARRWMERLWRKR